MNIDFERLSQAKVTSGLMIINIIIFVIMTLNGGSESIENLIKFGANSKSLVANGQWWRLFTASFIHIGFFHILFNMYFLNSLGPLFENMFGSVRFLIIYLIAGVFGNLLSFAFGSPYTVSAGASTSLYGMLGLAIGLMVTYKNDEIVRSFGASFISVVVINIIYSLIAPGVGIYGHLGGFIAGFLLAGIFPIWGRDIATSRRIISLIILLGASFTLYRVGIKSMIGV
ncbi:rhomboid family intramembrane serine protease [uncultured Anaerococcus sp.]|mgnify:CR=1 FL=1|uniref:rhomboid family intramembrane serine protease n=1 Tax=uncultured Anaerococcus sp. TaxID=293428 RepID=UPI0025EE5F11|nr:rhomboid family intramembrane serine protease [uncultured Anaerococcus sp.]